MRKKQIDKSALRLDYSNVHRIGIDDTIGIISDTHLCSKYDNLNKLNEYYDLIDSRGIKQVYHAGDLADGINMYRGQLNDLRCWGYEDQVDYIVKNYPRKSSLKTYFVAGNHDASFKRVEGADIGKYIMGRRDDLQYLGAYYARVKDDISLDLVHPESKTSAYALSYSAQVYLRNLPPNYYPDILVMGHHHKLFYTYYQNVHCFEAGVFMSPNDLFIRQGKVGNIGGWIIEMEREKKRIKKMKSELVL